MAKVSKLVSYVHRSSQASDLFEGEHCLQVANTTRWNSQLTMVEFTTDNAEITASSLRFTRHATAGLQWQVECLRDSDCEGPVEILTPFKWATNLTQGGNKVTAC